MGVSEQSVRNKIRDIRKEGKLFTNTEWRKDELGRPREMQVCGLELVKEIKSRIKYRRVKVEEE